MKIYTAVQIKKADAFTIKNEPISSVDLMERAAKGAFNWIHNKYSKRTVFSIFCGVGNNGGDGLVIARLLHESGYKVSTYEIQFTHNYSQDYVINKQRLKDAKIPVIAIKSESDFGEITYGNVIIDCVFGSGLSRGIEGWVSNLIEVINNQPTDKIAIDIASGLYSENNDTNKGVVFKPNYTLTFQFPKLAFLFPGNARFVGDLVIIPIGISEDFILNEPTSYFTIQKFTTSLIHKKSSKFDYKGTYGHALIMAGSNGKMGAAILAAKACLKSGAGLVTAHIPNHGNDIMQISVPEVMTCPDSNKEYLSDFKDVSKFESIGFGPGIGQEKSTISLLQNVLESYAKPMVLDADALNILSSNKEWLNLIPKHSILTPHLGELRRLIGDSKGDFDQLELTKAFAKKYESYVVIKGAYSAIVCPNGEVFFNTTGNPGMATAGSGDVLTGILTGLLAQGYKSVHASILGVYIHGLAGDYALKKESRESITASDIIQNLSVSFQNLKEI